MRERRRRLRRWRQERRRGWQQRQRVCERAQGQIRLLLRTQQTALLAEAVWFHEARLQKPCRQTECQWRSPRPATAAEWTESPAEALQSQRAHKILSILQLRKLWSTCGGSVGQHNLLNVGDAHPGCILGHMLQRLHRARLCELQSLCERSGKAALATPKRGKRTSKHLVQTCTPRRHANFTACCLQQMQADNVRAITGARTTYCCSCEKPCSQLRSSLLR